MRFAAWLVVMILGSTLGCETVQLRRPATDTERTPADEATEELTLVAPTHPAVGLAASLHHTCAVLSNGEVKCWGRNRSGATSSDEGDSSPRTVTTLESALRIATSRVQSCAVADGQVHCWGRQAYTPPRGPHEVSALGGAVDIATGSTHTCVVRDDKRVICTGQNDCQQRGIRGWRNAPVELENVASVVAGKTHTCARVESGQVACWGCNYAQQLGTERIRNATPTPQVVPGLSGVISLSSHSAGDQTCALSVAAGSAQVACWGTRGLSSGGRVTIGAEPQQLEPPPNAADVFAGIFDVFVVTEEGDLYRYQQSEGSAGGDADAPAYGSPEKVEGVSDVVEVGIGLAHTCVRTTGGHVLCWGSNAQGQLGDGTTENRQRPTPVIGLGAAVDDNGNGN